MNQSKYQEKIDLQGIGSQLRGGSCNHKNEQKEEHQQP